MWNVLWVHAMSRQFASSIQELLWCCLLCQIINFNLQSSVCFDMSRKFDDIIIIYGFMGMWKKKIHIKIKSSRNSFDDDWNNNKKLIFFWVWCLEFFFSWSWRLITELVSPMARVKNTLCCKNDWPSTMALDKIL